MPLVGAIAAQRPSIYRVAQIGVEKDFTKVSFNIGIKDRRQHLYAPVEIAVHKVGTADEDLCRLGIAICEPKDSAVLQETSHQTSYANILREAFYPRPQSADSAYDQFDLNARF